MTTKNRMVVQDVYKRQVGCIVFFTTIAIVAGKLSAGALPAYMIVLIVVLPLVMGIVCGWIAGLFLRKDRNDRITICSLIITIILTSIVGFIFNDYIMPKPVLNFMLIGKMCIRDRHNVVYNLLTLASYKIIRGEISNGVMSIFLPM